MDEHYYEYRTGHTQPKKSRNGPVAFLLICVIFLGGIVSALGMLNIRLFRKLQQTDLETPLSFSHGDLVPATTDPLSLSVEGITLQELPSLYQKLYNLPAGLYITHVSAGSHAEKQGIAPADVLLAVNGTAVCQLDTLQTLLDQAGTQAVLTLYQNGKENQLTLPLHD